MKLPRDVSGSDAVKALNRLGFETGIRASSHVRMVKGECSVIIPRRERIDPRTLKSVLRQACISVEEFIAAI